MIKGEASTADYHTLAATVGKAERPTKRVTVDRAALDNVLIDYVRLQQFADAEYRTKEEEL